MKTLLGVVLALVSAGIGCGAPPTAGSCTLTSGGICEEFSSSYNADQVRAACPSSAGTYSPDGCSATNRIGHCTVGAGTVEITQSYYAPMTASDAMTACMRGGGTWTAN